MYIQPLLRSRISMLTHDQKHHVFFNKEGFHNHIVHHILTLYGLGAPAEIIEQRYKENATYQRPAIQLEERVLEETELFEKCLGKEKYYQDFLVFWQNEFEKKGWEKVLNEYVFSGDERGDNLLGRFYGGIFRFLSGWSIQF
jgi:Questin oxidase-like